MKPSYRLQSTVSDCPAGLAVPGDPGIPSTPPQQGGNNFSLHASVRLFAGFSDGLGAKIFGGPGKSSIRALGITTRPSRPEPSL
jgi:hypothetical protein